MNQKDAALLQVLTSKSQADKAINSLKGILEGINLDRDVNEAELNELSIWSSTHKDLIARNPFREFMEIIHQAVSYDLPPTEVAEDLFWLCQKYESDNYYYKAVTADLQTLQGLCHGILADGEINDDEIFALHNWLEQNDHLNTYYPYDEIRSLVLSIVSDKVVTEDERLVLKAYFNQFVKIQDAEIADKINEETKNLNVSALLTSDPQIEIVGKTFCITGILKRMERKRLQDMISGFGGIPVNSVSKTTDYLIVGDNGNPAWAFACYGRKVENALKLRKEGHTITLVHEFDFCDFIEDYKG